MSHRAGLSWANVKKGVSCLRSLHWYLSKPGQMPLISNLDEHLPLPNVQPVKVLWPHKYSWAFGGYRLDMIKAELARLPQAELHFYDVDKADFDWHRRGGFPVPADKRHLIGTLNNPKGPNDIRGEIFEMHKGDCVVRIAYDYSDYMMISTEILDQVDIYVKCTTPFGPLPEKVVNVGIPAGNYPLLAKARKKILKNPPKKQFDVYGRFGSWTDSQPLRQMVVSNLKASDLHFTGGFDLRIYPVYLQELMRARLALELPGQGPWSHRLVESMALGVVAISPKPMCQLPEEPIDGVHYAAIERDGSNVVEVCHALLKDEERQQRIAHQAKLFFDDNFSPQSKMRRILRKAFPAAY